MNLFKLSTFRRSCSALTACLTVVAASCAVVMPSLASAQEKVSLRVASFMPPQGFLNQALVLPFLDKVVADSQGTLEYKFFPGGTLGRAPTEQLKLVQDGVADIAIVIPSYTPGVFEDFDVSQLPGLAKDTKSASVALWKSYEAGLLPTPDKVQWLGLATTASNVLHTRKPTENLKDLAGQKIRAAGSLQMAMVNTAGGVGVGNVRGPELAEALSRNLLDGSLMDWIGIKEFRLDRLTNYHVDYDFGRLATSLVINAEKLASLPEPARAAFAKHGGLAYAIAGGMAFDKEVNQYREDYIKSGKHKAKGFSEADQATLQKSFEKVVDDWKGAAPRREKLVEIFRDAASDASRN